MKGSSRLLLPASSRAVLFCVALFLLFPAPAVPGAEPRLKTAGSSSGRFYVSAPDSVTAVQTARWAEEVARRAEQAFGLKMTFGPARVFRIVIRADGGRPCGVEASQSSADGMLVQQLAADDFSGADWEEGLEQFCALLVGGCIAEKRAGRDRVPAPARAPEWLSAGLAQYIDPELRSRNRAILKEWRREGSVPALAEVLKWHVLPPGRNRDKSLCGVAVGWLCSNSGRAALFDRVFEALCAGETLTPDRLRGAMPACKTAADLETAWRAWIDRECSVVSAPGVLTSDWIRALRAGLAAVPGECGVPADIKWQAPAEPATLIGVKKAGWMPGFCSAKIAAIRRMEAGRPQEFVDVAESYVRFLDALGRRSRDGTLEKLLSQADEACDALDRRVWMRERYMDEMERIYGGADSGTNAPSAAHDVVERSRLQRYIDSVEDRVKQAEPGAGE